MDVVQMGFLLWSWKIEIQDTCKRLNIYLGLKQLAAGAHSLACGGSIVEELSAEGAAGTAPKGDFGTLEIGVVDSAPPESCQEGILGRPRLSIELGAEGDSGRLVTRSAFSDFSSCCSSANEWDWASRFASSICKLCKIRCPLE